MTIFAISTGAGRAGIAVIRVSGPDSAAAVTSIAGPPVPQPRFAALRRFRHPSTGEELDRGLVLWFPAPQSFTGEDSAEFHIHGSRAVIEAMFEALRLLGLRLAEPGEFARRAFQNGKLDLTEVEGLSDLINADTAMQRRQALSQAGGGLRKRYESWRHSLLRAMAYVEASLDFADEADVAEGAFSLAVPEIETLARSLREALADGRRGEIVREGIQVAIVGEPNVGKSSLLNALVRREAAIVFDEPGTTRDIIEVTLDLDGFPFVLRDTAGLRETESGVEQEGIRRALAAADEADVVLYMRDASAPHPGPLPIGKGATASLLPLGEGQDEGRDARNKKHIAILNKIDLAPDSSAHNPDDSDEQPLPISAKTGEGIEDVKAALIAFAKNAYGASETPLITRARHRQELEKALAALERFLHMANPETASELLAEDLREAADALSRLTGRLDVEDVLGEIFSEFCIGK